MPATYAHYRFGQMAFQSLAEEERKSAQRFRQLYNMGLHGPDLFFFYQPLFSTKMGALGNQYHGLSGKELFETAVAHLKEAPSEGAAVYLYGVLAHYALDSLCHPLIRQQAADGKIGHTELEVEFDRYLLTLDGKVPAHNYSMARLLRLTWGGCVTVAGFYPPASAYTIRRCVLVMSLISRLLAIKHRELLQRICSLGGEEASQMVMYPRPNHKCAHLNEPLQALFDEALERYAILAKQLKAYIESGEPLGPEFDVTFG